MIPEPTPAQWATGRRMALEIDERITARCLRTNQLAEMIARALAAEVHKQQEHQSCDS